MHSSRSVANIADHEWVVIYDPSGTGGVDWRSENQAKKGRTLLERGYQVVLHEHSQGKGMLAVVYLLVATGRHQRSIHEVA